MSTTVRHVHGARNADHLRKSISGPNVQVTLRAERLRGPGTELQAESTVVSALCVLVLASVSVGCVIGIGIANALGAR